MSPEDGEEGHGPKVYFKEAVLSNQIETVQCGVSHIRRTL